MEKLWSIIIPARNEERCLGKCLDALVALEYDLGKVEVVVADNGSTDSTVALAWAYEQRLNLKVVSVPGLPVGAVRNAAVLLTHGQRLAFLDSDCLVKPSWLEVADREMNRDPPAIVGSFYALPTSAGWPARFWHKFFEQEQRGKVNFLPAGNILMPRSIFHALGGFDGNLRSNEDSELCARATRAAFDIDCIPELATTHLGAERDLAHFVRRQLWHGSNVVHRTGLRVNSRAIALAAYTLALLVLTFVTAVSGQGRFATLAFGCLLLPSAALAVYQSSRMHQIRSAPTLAVLVLAYSLARACVLPVAVARSLRGPIRF